jgi:hypothetical protein
MSFCSPLRNEASILARQHHSREKHAAESVQVIAFPFAISRVLDTPQALQNLLDELETSRVSRKRAWEVSSFRHQQERLAAVSQNVIRESLTTPVKNKASLSHI